MGGGYLKSAFQFQGETKSEANSKGERSLKRCVFHQSAFETLCFCSRAVQTLLYEPGWDSAGGNAELLKYITKNPNNCTFEDVKRCGTNFRKTYLIGKYIESV